MENNETVKDIDKVEIFELKKLVDKKKSYCFYYISFIRYSYFYLGISCALGSYE